MLEYRHRPDLDQEELRQLFALARGPRTCDFRPVLERSFTCVGAYNDGVLVRFFNVAWDGGVHFFLLDTAVHPDWQHRGIGTRLVREAVADCREQGASLHVDSSAELADFYPGFGVRDTHYAGLLSVAAVSTFSTGGG